MANSNSGGARFAWAWASPASPHAARRTPWSTPAPAPSGAPTAEAAVAETKGRWRRCLACGGSQGLNIWTQGGGPGSAGFPGLAAMATAGTTTATNDAAPLGRDAQQHEVSKLKADAEPATSHAQLDPASLARAIRVVRGLTTGPPNSTTFTPKADQGAAAGETDDIVSEGGPSLEAKASCET